MMATESSRCDPRPLRVHTPAALLTTRRQSGIAAGAVDVWAYELAADASMLARLHDWLAADERARAARFVYERDRNAFIVGRAILRLLLSRYLGRSPASLAFIYGGSGKPALAPDDSGQQPLRFNLSHSEGRAVLAVTRAHELGVDIERCGRRLDILAIADRYFFGTEFAAIAAAAPADQTAVFLRYWVAKEAVLKAEGIGIGFALDRFAICFNSAQDLATVTTHVGCVPACHWQVRPLAVDAGWYAALAIPDGTLALNFPDCDGS